MVSPLYVNEYLDSSVSRVGTTGIRVPAFARSGRLYRAANELMAPWVLSRFRPDIVHETYYARNSPASREYKVVVTVFDMIHELFPERFPKRDPTRNEKAAAVERADHIICISESTRKDLILTLNVQPEKTSVVHLGFSLTAQPKGTANSFRRPYLLHVGYRGEYKNFAGLMAAYASKPELHRNYDLLAFGAGSFSSEEQSAIARLGLSETQVRQIGGGDDVLAALYKGAALFVYPSLYEGFGIPPLEAMSFDCPVACSNTSSIPEVVDDAAVYFDPASVESMANTLVQLLGDPLALKALINKGRERIKLFSWESCARKTLDIYQTVLS